MYTSGINLYFRPFSCCWKRNVTFVLWEYNDGTWQRICQIVLRAPKSTQHFPIWKCSWASYWVFTWMDIWSWIESNWPENWGSLMSEYELVTDFVVFSLWIGFELIWLGVEGLARIVRESSDMHLIWYICLWSWGTVLIDGLLGLKWAPTCVHGTYSRPCNVPTIVQSVVA